ncbi:MAG: hypothetical protein ABJI43_20910 [Roseobacter sp.]
MDNLEELIALLKAQYQRSQLPLKSLTDRETQLRAELLILRNQMTEIHKQGLNDEPEMRAMGADVAWERWVEISLTSLNLELVKVIAEKQNHLASVRINFGKFKAAESAQLQARLRAKRQMQKRDLEQTISSSIFNNLA